MAASVLSILHNKLCGILGKLNLFFLIPTTLALFTCLFIIFYITFTSNLFFQLYPHSPPFNSTLTKPTTFTFTQALHSGTNNQHLNKENTENRSEVFHDRDIFVESYKDMNRSLKIYVYPHRKDDPFANVLLPVNFAPGGNYASESYFKKVLVKSHFVTKIPSEADFFFMPFSIARLRHDARVGITGLPEFISRYIFNISHNYPYWNRTGGADHFYAACHSVGKIAMQKASEVKFNAIQVVCSSSYFVSSYVPHKDASLPQIWPRQGDPPNLTPYNR
ncbi:glycosyltransferase [Lithospermum erythrorhizon]|uniref:Glycosyltransferase n=1 Tax=Lithospermum erythrorhizon TaxID=34254 RepID=A0AAV3P0U5_LITER